MSSSKYNDNKYWEIFLVMICVVMLSSCARNKTVCSDESIIYIDEIASFPPLADTDITEGSSQVLADINEKRKLVDHIVTGPVCNVNWSGTIYVDCDIQIAAWEEAPRFFEKCNFKVEPGTTIIVAPHNNETFYKGCSCHTGEEFFE
ncbi:MAG: hypothetical protein H8E29_15165 [Anaerolineales bacterium]|uniref:Uncharacterized protein n=1 Tax=Candidatus Desulfolinea nitratireducens TaxID=2841698 RepID=A0A8J6TJL2_9CHLR|nr:hypothetical protein [Candidatus Desulfolinea nitratireducens]